MAELADSILLATDAIPSGQVSTYGDIAKVVRSNGTIAEHLVDEASTRLAAEGVAVRAGRVDLKLHRAALD